MRTLLKLLTFFLIVLHYDSMAVIREDTAVVAKEIFGESEWTQTTKDLSYPDGQPMKKVKPANEKGWKFNIPSWLKYPVYAVVFCILILLIYKIITLILRPGNRKTDRRISFDELTEETAPVDRLEELLDAAISKGDLRNAVRFGYLIVLRNLADRRLISRTMDKTNNDYFRELAGHPSAGIFRKITRTYELTWYGEIIPSGEEYNKFTASFRTFLESINNPVQYDRR
jgi:hypothetical protein